VHTLGALPRKCKGSPKTTDTCDLLAWLPLLQVVVVVVVVVVVEMSKSLPSSGTISAQVHQGDAPSECELHDVYEGTDQLATFPCLLPSNGGSSVSIRLGRVSGHDRSRRCYVLTAMREVITSRLASNYKVGHSHVVDACCRLHMPIEPLYQELHTSPSPSTPLMATPSTKTVTTQQGPHLRSYILSHKPTSIKCS
jgi:hypothetical protein